MKYKLLITNNRFQQKGSRKWTWLLPDSIQKSMIDLILIGKRCKSAVQIAEHIRMQILPLIIVWLCAQFRLDLNAQVKIRPRIDLE